MKQSNYLAKTIQSGQITHFPTKTSKNDQIVQAFDQIVQVFFWKLPYFYGAFNKKTKPKVGLLVSATQPPTQKEGAGGFFSITVGSGDVYENGEWQPWDYFITLRRDS